MSPAQTEAEFFRTLLGCFATGVTVATAVDSSGRHRGMTASAVSAVSLQPPILLICVDRDAKFHAALSEAPGFALSVLASDQQDISETFACSVEDPFAAVEWETGPNGLSLLRGAVAHIICESRATYAAGDHTVFFGTVTGGESFGRPPLVHYRSRYTTTTD